MPVNGRNMTNVGLFRQYISEYTRNHPQIRKDMTMLVRQLQPTEHGLPIELYMFTSDTRWAIYEDIMSDIFDHLLAAIKYFRLEVRSEERSVGKECSRPCISRWSQDHSKKKKK